MEGVAAQVAKEKGYTSSDYRDVIRELKKDQITGDAILPFYKAAPGGHRGHHPPASTS